MNERQKTLRFAARVPESNFLVHYAKGTEDWSDANVDDALTLPDAYKLAQARQALGFRTKITEKKTGTEIP